MTDIVADQPLGPLTTLSPAYSECTIKQSTPTASKGGSPVRDAGHEPLLLKPGESQETPTRPRRGRQQTITTQREQLGAPSAITIISTLKQSQIRRQNDTQPPRGRHLQSTGLPTPRPHTRPLVDLSRGGSVGLVALQR